MLSAYSLKHVRYNFIVNVLDGTFFGFALGFASTGAIIPLFFSTLTEDTALIGFVGSMHTIGWYLPQLLTAPYVSRLRRYKRMVMFMTVHERWPFFGLALVAWFAPELGKELALLLGLLFMFVHSIGGGLAATAWQSMIGKIMPSNRRATFWGTQSAAANLLLALGAVLAGSILQNIPSPYDFALCFAIAGFWIMLSMGFLGMTREEASPEPEQAPTQQIAWRQLVNILNRDANFRWFLIARNLALVAWMAVGFYSIYAVRHLGVSAATASLMVGAMSLAQVAANPILGWIGDKWGHRKVYVFGALMVTLSALVAIVIPEQNQFYPFMLRSPLTVFSAATVSPEQSWFYLAFILAGFANAVLWTISMAMTIQFGAENEKPLYIGLANTSVAPVAIAAPILVGWLADHAGFGTTFMISVAAGLLTAFIMYFVVQNPREITTLEERVRPAIEPALVEC